MKLTLRAKYWIRRFQNSAAGLWLKLCGGQCHQCSKTHERYHFSFFFYDH